MLVQLLIPCILGPAGEKGLRGPAGERGEPGPATPANGRPGRRFSTYGLIDFADFGKLSPQRLTEFDHEFIISARKWNTVLGSFDRNLLELQELLLAYQIDFLATIQELAIRINNKTSGRTLIERSADNQAWFSMQVNRGMVFSALLVEIMEFRGLGERM